MATQRLGAAFNTAGGSTPTLNNILKILGLAAVSATLVLAQRTGPGGTPPDPATMIQMRVDRLATLLSLTDAQKTQATTIFTNAYSAGQSIHTTLQTDTTNLAAAVKANNISTIDSLSATIGSLQGQLTAINAKADAAFYAILTADQKAKYDALPHGGPGGPGFGPGPGGRGFRGGPPQ